MAKLRVDIAIPAERYVELYSGRVKNIHAVSWEGLSVQFPGSILHRFITHDGIYGTFDLHFDEHNKLLSVSKLT